MVNNYGTFVISLDFELFWGVRDVQTKHKYGENILGARAVIPRLIELFEQYGVHSTFATVGLLFCNSREEIDKYSPRIKPTYKNKKLSPYEFNYLDELDKISDPYHSGTDLIELLKGSSNIEIGTHTFSHYYCWEEGQSIQEFEEDIIASIKIANAYGLEIKNIVFPRNQIDNDYLQVCVKHGITHYRGNPFYFFNRNGGLKDKLLRLIDTYIKIVRDTTYGYDEIKVDKYLYNIKASRFLRPFTPKSAIFEELKIRRIKNEMTLAAIQNRIYHLWWHPHNFGLYQERNISLLENILKHYKMLYEKFGFKSLAMSDLTY